MREPSLPSHSEPDSPRDGLGTAPRVVLEGLLHRGELASLEFRAARAHFATTGAVAAVVGALFLLAGMTGTLAIAALVWERGDRALILGLVALGYVLGAAAMAWWVAARLRSWHPLAETRHQIREDCACLSQNPSANTR